MALTISAAIFTPAGFGSIITHKGNVAGKIFIPELLGPQTEGLAME